jgi:hypothetical protein
MPVLPLGCSPESRSARLRRSILAKKVLRTVRPRVRSKPPLARNGFAGAFGLAGALAIVCCCSAGLRDLVFGRGSRTWLHRPRVEAGHLR